jgi:preprotein translocase subunit SecE
LAFAPAKFLREVRAEAVRVTWPGRRETLGMTGMVLLMAVFAGLFFFLVDQIVGLAVRALFTGSV